MPDHPATLAELRESGWQSRTVKEELCENFVRALEAGAAAGGEFKQIKSAALLVVHEQAFPLVDLRVEFDRAPLAELRFLWETYQPQMERFVTQVIDPDSLPYPSV